MLVSIYNYVIINMVILKMERLNMKEKKKYEIIKKWNDGLISGMKQKIPVAHRHLCAAGIFW